MQTKKVLARKDGYSIIVAICLALALTNPLGTFSMLFSSKILGSQEGFYTGVGQDFKAQYVNPLLTLLLQVIMIEVALRIIAMLMPAKKKK